MFQPYDPCPCGSGKKFKWCCQSFYSDIRRADAQFEQGQHETALRQIDEVIKTHPQSTEALGTKARFLANLGQTEQADEVLELAFAINPNYPNGLLMRAQLRMNEGEIGGAMLLARRAAEAYDPAAHESLALVYHILFDNEMAHQRPIAGHAALSLATQFAPSSEDLREATVNYFGPESPLPEAARKTYALRRPASNDAQRRARWEAGLAEVAPSRLGDLAKLCDEIARQDEKDAAAWFNLGLARAWLGENATAVEALEQSIQHETDDASGRETGALGEVLRMGMGLEEQCDQVHYAFGFALRDPRPVADLLTAWSKEGRLLVQPTEEKGTFFTLVLDIQKGIATSEGSTTSDTGTFAAYLSIIGQTLRVRGPKRESVEHLRDIFRERLSLSEEEATIVKTPAPFRDVILPALLLPTPGNTSLTNERVHDAARRYFQETWLHQPLKSLAGNSPIDAAGSAVLKRKLAGIVDFLQQCTNGLHVTPADFNGVRHHLGLEPVPEPVAEQKPVEGQKPTTVNVAGLNAAELAGLDVTTLTLRQVEQAHQAALKLDAKELARHFAEAIVARPAEPEKNDRFAIYSYLILRELADGEPSKALEYAESGRQFDAEQNGGARRDEFDLRTGQVLAKQGQTEKAAEVFHTLFERSPDKAKLRIEAIEALIRMKKGTLALNLAEAGLNVARDRGDRDSEEVFNELAAAARKTAG